MKSKERKPENLEQEKKIPEKKISEKRYAGEIFLFLDAEKCFVQRDM